MKITILMGILMAVPAGAQSSSDAKAMQALLTEVHQLRLALERSALLAPRMQLALERAQMQEQRVARISQQLDEVRKQAAAEGKRRTGAAEELPKIEEALAGAPEGEHRKELEMTRNDLKRLAEAPLDAQLSAREAELAGALEREQAMLNELNGKLDAIEKQLEASPLPNR